MASLVLPQTARSIWTRQSDPEYSTAIIRAGLALSLFLGTTCIWAENLEPLHKPWLTSKQGNDSPIEAKCINVTRIVIRQEIQELLPGIWAVCEHLITISRSVAELRMLLVFFQDHMLLCLGGGPHVPLVVGLLALAFFDIFRKCGGDELPDALLTVVHLAWEAV